MRRLCLTVALVVASAAAANALTLRLTDSAVFSANSNGENSKGWIRNTRGATDDLRNMYHSGSVEPENPAFVNSGNGPETELNIALAPGTHRFVIYGDQTGQDPGAVPRFQFAVNLSVNGALGPSISGLTCPAGICANSHPNGVDFFGVSGRQGAGTRTHAVAGHTVTLTGFTWVADDAVDLVGPYFARLFDGSGSGRPVWVGTIELHVEGGTVVPLPAAA
jgi:hypothetical protein